MADTSLESIVNSLQTATHNPSDSSSYSFFNLFKKTTLSTKIFFLFLFLILIVLVVFAIMLIVMGPEEFTMVLNPSYKKKKRSCKKNEDCDYLCSDSDCCVKCNQKSGKCEKCSTSLPEQNGVCNSNSDCSCPFYDLDCCSVCINNACVNGQITNSGNCVISLQQRDQHNNQLDELNQPIIDKLRNNYMYADADADADADANADANKNSWTIKDINDIQKPGGKPTFEIINQLDQNEENPQSVPLQEESSCVDMNNILTSEEIRKKSSLNFQLSDSRDPLPQNGNYITNEYCHHKLCSGSNSFEGCCAVASAGNCIQGSIEDGTCQTMVSQQLFQGYGDQYPDTYVFTTNGSKIGTTMGSCFTRPIESNRVMNNVGYF